MQSDSYTGSVTWVKSLQFVAHASKSGAAFVLDGTPEVGGFGSGVLPMEALLLSLASCTGMDVIAVLRKKRQNVSAFAVNVTGTRADEHPKAYTHIELEFVVGGTDISENAIRRAIELSQTKYCGATASLRAEVTYTYRVEAA